MLCLPLAGVVSVGAAHFGLDSQRQQPVRPGGRVVASTAAAAGGICVTTTCAHRNSRTVLPGRHRLLLRPSTVAVLGCRAAGLPFRRDVVVVVVQLGCRAALVVVVGRTFRVWADAGVIIIMACRAGLGCDWAGIVGVRVGVGVPCSGAAPCRVVAQ